MATTNLTSTASLSSLMQIYYDRLMLDRLKKVLRFHSLGTPKQLPANSGKTIYWTRRTLQSAVTSTITEGTVPAAIGLSAKTVSAQLSQYGNFTQTSDLISLTSIDDEVAAAVDDLSYMAALSLDTIDRNLLDNDTAGIQYANGKTALSAVYSTDVLTGAEVRKAVRKLKSNDVHPYDDGYFMAIVHPNNSYDLQSDTASGGWVNANTYVEQQALYNGELGRFAGARFVESSNVTFTASGTSGSSNVYNDHFLGKGAFGVIDFDGGIHIYVKRSGDQDTSNPLNQYATVGYKMTYSNAILDSNRHVTVVAGSAF
jgi:N4-gp56 family major capsid protein